MDRRTRPWGAALSRVAMVPGAGWSRKGGATGMPGPINAGAIGCAAMGLCELATEEAVDLRRSVPGILAKGHPMWRSCRAM